MKKKPQTKIWIDSIRSFFALRRLRFQPLAPFCTNGQEFIFTTNKSHSHLYLSEYEQGRFPKKKRRLLDIEHNDWQNIRFFQVLPTEHGFELFFYQKTTAKEGLFRFHSSDLFTWKFVGFYEHSLCPRTIILHQNQFLYFSGSETTSLSFSDRTHWDGDVLDLHLFSPRPHFFDYAHTSVFAAVKRPEGILVLYDASKSSDSGMHSQIGALLLDAKNPRHILWRANTPLWQEFKDRAHSRKILGCCFLEDEFVVYFKDNAQGSVSRVALDYPFTRLRSRREPLPTPPLLRHDNNPILEVLDRHDWEAQAVFNPAVWDDGQHVHLIYRAIGNDGVSRLGYARSEDGFHFSKRLSYPILELKNLRKKAGSYSPTLYPSGGSWGGAEDPRVVEIDGTLHLTVSAFDGWDFIRITEFSCAAEDSKAQKFQWSRPRFLSPAGEIHKNWVLFPEKIHGKFAILHNISLQVEVEYIDSLDDLHSGRVAIQSSFQPFASTSTFWEKRMRGVGPPPIRTEHGWLVFYHAMDEAEPHRYKLGAMLLDLEDPSKILYRSRNPILEPDADYENCDKPGVVYACGVSIRDGVVRVYYGGSDKVVCVASAQLDTFLKTLMQRANPTLQSRPVTIE